MPTVRTARASRLPHRRGASRLLGIILLAALLGGGCRASREPASPAHGGEGAFPAIVEAANGRIEIEARPRRIVSLSPTATETLFAIGAGAQVVAVDRSSNHPQDAPRTELSGFDPNIEAVAAFEPDLVIYSTDAGNLEQSLETIGATALMQPAAEDLDQAYDQILQLGSATGHRQSSEDLVDAMKADVSRTLERRRPSTDSPTYYHELDVSGYTATSRTFVGDIYRLLGLRNIADAAGGAGAYVQLSSEYIVRSDPDLIFLADAKCCGQSLQTLAQRPGWLQIEAVRMGRTFELDDDVASRWGPRTVELIRFVAHALDSLDSRPTAPP